jgi:hypothetical protein
MNKKHQVFVSSTYIDLIDERKELVQALLELDCIPAGMEMFPASNEDQWSLIKRVIDECDYYVLIIGNRYGSLSENGISYTEKEYDYAAETGVPILAFIHSEPENIAVKHSELDADKRAKLDAFKLKVQNKLVKFYNTPEDLGGKVSRALVQLISRVERPGWIRGDAMAGDEARDAIEKLRSENEVLRQKLSQIDTLPPPGTENLASGDFEFTVSYSGYNKSDGTLNVSWDDVFVIVGPLLFNEATEPQMHKELNSQLVLFIENEIELGLQYKHKSWFALDNDCFHQIKTQLRALGLIKLSDKKRAVRDTGTYWTLTNYGDQYLTKLMAIPKN